MIIPIRCFGCGKVLGNKYDYFIEKVIERKQKLDKNKNEKTNKLSIIDFSSDKLTKTIEGEVLDEIGCIRICCRSKMLSHISLIDEI